MLLPILVFKLPRDHALLRRSDAFTLSTLLFKLLVLAVVVRCLGEWGLDAQALTYRLTLLGLSNIV